MTDESEGQIRTGRYATAMDRGAAIIREFARTLPEGPGVYRMMNEGGDLLYVGKARMLKHRVMSYTRPARLPLRLKRMIAETATMEFINTHTEVEALLLEANLIKRLKPRYNILLRDDKSFPYILIGAEHAFPRLSKHRGARQEKGDYFGPFASAGAVNRTVTILQRVFMLRTCTDTDFAGRRRPCLQYHIKRCTAPCVGKVSAAQYGEQIRDARMFLTGKSRDLQQRFIAAMQEASDNLEFELAARYRDRVRALADIQASQDINVEELDDADVIALCREGGRVCVQAFFFRGGQNFGNRAFFPDHDAEDNDANIMTAFLAQFYDNKPLPPEVILNIEPAERDLLYEALAEKRGQPPGRRKFVMAVPARGPRRRVVDFVFNNAREALRRYQAETSTTRQLLAGVAALFGLEESPTRIEVYDNSHISGTNMVGAMIVAGPEGFRKSAYRKFNIRDAAGGDDFAMMREVMRRRFGKTAPLGAPGEKHAEWPDLVLIDGGQGQFGAVRDVLTELGVWDALCVVGIAKGPDRDAGREKFFTEGREMFQLPLHDPVLHYLQRLRDEAHRFAISAHRARRQAEIPGSPLDAVAGIGARRKKALLHHFGSAKAVGQASVRDLEKVEGINSAMAEKIYAHFHDVVDNDR